MYNVLVVDFSIYKDSISDILSNEGYNVEVCESAYAAMSKLKAYDFDLVISEIELPGDNAFDLYNYITENYPYIPTIMTTDKNIDGFFENIFKEGIGNIICKPLEKDELLNLTEKLVTKKNIFGLRNYLKKITEIKKIRITGSRQITKAIKALMNEIKEWGFEVENSMILNLVLNELAINAVYHSHGLTKEKEDRKPVKLEDGQFVEIFFARSNSGYAIAIDDYNGRLSRIKILNTINSVIEQNLLIEQAAISGEDISDKISETGRGLDLVRKLSAEYYFIIKKNIQTEIILIFDKPSNDKKTKYSSLKIIEDLSE